MNNKWMVLMSVPVMAMACSEAVDSGDTDPADARDATFLVDGRADTGGVEEGSAEAEAVLALVNEASFETLDDDASLDRRAADNIVAYRLGDDMRAGTADDETYDDLAELDRIPYVGPVAFQSLLEFALQQDVEPGEVSVHGVLEGSREADAILAAANGLDLTTLDDEVELDARAANNIISYRAGVDGTLDTGDDREFANLTELDRISWVGSRAFGRLLRYAEDHDLIAPDDGTRDGESDDPFSTEFCQGDPMTTAQAVGHFSEGATSTSLGDGSWHYRTRQCNELTGCGEWTDVRNDYISAHVQLSTRGGKVYLQLADTPVSSERNIYCNSASVDSDQVTCRAVDQRYRSTYYKGHVTDHCVRLGYTHKTDPDSRSTWRETQYVFTERFAASQERTFGGHTTPGDDAEPDSPFATASCNDAPLSTEGALEFFDPGEDTAPFSSGEWSRRTRNCNELTGCTAWNETQGFATATTTLNIRGEKVYTAISDTPVSSERNIYCNSASVDSQEVTCRAVDQRYRSTYYRGRVSDDCMRLEYVNTSEPGSRNEYSQTQYVYYQRH